MLGEIPTATTEFATAVTPDNVDELCRIMETIVSGAYCTLIMIGATCPDGTPSGNVMEGLTLTDFHTSHPAPHRAGLYFNFGAGLFTLPVGQGDERTSQAGVNHAATMQLESNTVILSYVESNDRRFAVIRMH